MEREESGRSVRKEVQKEGKEDMDVKCRNRRLWCPCRGKGGRREGEREKKREERSEGCWDSELASNGV